MKNNCLFLILVLLATAQVSFSQGILITDADFDASSPLNCTIYNDGSIDNFYDSGGNSANYGDNENEIITICPNLAMGTKVTFKAGTTAPFTWNVDASDTLYVYDGASTSAPLVGAYNSITNPFGVTITASWSNPSGCLTLRFKSDGAVNASGFDANLTCGTPFQPFDPHIQAFLNGSGPNILAPADTGYADICFGDSVLLVASGTFPNSQETTGHGYSQNNNNCVYTWDFTDGTSRTGDSVWFRPPNRAGYAAYLKMVDPAAQAEYLKCRIRVSTIPSFADVMALEDTICLGETTTIVGGVISGDTVGVIPTTGVFEAGGTFGGQTYLPDGSGTNYSTSININGFLPGQTITSGSNIQNMCVTMEHSYLGDLEMSLTCPNGTTVNIFNAYVGTGLFPGGFGGGGTFLGQADDGPDGVPGIGWQYCFSDGAVWGDFPAEFGAGNFTTVTSPSAGQSMATGDYKPEQLYSSLIGCPINGSWTLTVRDNQSIDDGFIFEWGIFFDPSINPNTEYYKPEIVTDAWQADPTILSGLTDTAIVVKPVAPGPHSYTFSVTDDFGCTYDTTVTIHVIGLPVLPASAQTCDLFYQINGVTAPGGVLWSVAGQPSGSTVDFTASTSTLNPLISVSEVGDYQLTVSDLVCNVSQTFTIEYLDDPHPVLSDTTLCSFDVLLLAVKGIKPDESFLWSTGGMGSAIQPTTSGTYYVNVTNQCATVSDTANVEFIFCDLMLPNVFTPNGDGKNDLLEFMNLDYFPGSALTVFNRWGTKIYKSPDYRNDWNGGGHPDGIYYYILEGPELKEAKYGYVQILNK